MVQVPARTFASILRAQRHSVMPPPVPRWAEWAHRCNLPSICTKSGSQHHPKPSFSSLSFSGGPATLLLLRYDKGIRMPGCTVSVYPSTSSSPSSSCYPSVRAAAASGHAYRRHPRWHQPQCRTPRRSLRSSIATTFGNGTHCCSADA